MTATSRLGRNCARACRLRLRGGLVAAEWRVFDPARSRRRGLRGGLAAAEWRVFDPAAVGVARSVVARRRKPRPAAARCGAAEPLLSRITSDSLPFGAAIRIVAAFNDVKVAPPTETRPWVQFGPRGRRQFDPTGSAGVPGATLAPSCAVKLAPAAGDSRLGHAHVAPAPVPSPPASTCSSAGRPSG